MIGSNGYGPYCHFKSILKCCTCTYLIRSLLYLHIFEYFLPVALKGIGLDEYGMFLPCLQWKHKYINPSEPLKSPKLNHITNIKSLDFSTLHTFVTKKT